MAQIGHGYGSEWHLMQTMGRLRVHFDDEVKRTLGAESIEWLDCNGFEDGVGLREHLQLDFLGLASAATREAWRVAWPQSGNVPNWDAVGKARVNGVDWWILVEAKASIQELHSKCNASSDSSTRKIKAVFRSARRALGITTVKDEAWLEPYYQFCNRLAILSFPGLHGIRAKLLMVYFVGDRSGPGRTCPADENAWRGAIDAMYQYLGFGKNEHVCNLLFPAFPLAVSDRIEAVSDTIPVRLVDGEHGTARIVGNNAAWLCPCGDRLPLLGTLFPPPRRPITVCPGCGRRFELYRRQDATGGVLDSVREIAPA